MDLVTQIIIIAAAGLGAGAVTGLASVSASTVVIPVLVGFKICDPYVAITISLMTDVMSSTFTAKTYAKNGNIKLKEGIIVAAIAVPAAIFASRLSAEINSEFLSYFSMATIALMAHNFYTKSKKLEKVAKGEMEPEPPKEKTFKNKTLALIASGAFVGFMSGLVGAGGGLKILLILTFIMGMGTRDAIGTSVFIMIFVALTSGVSHIMEMDPTLLEPLLSGITGVSGYGRLAIAIAISGVASIFAGVKTATYANNTEEYKLLRIISYFFMGLFAFNVISKFK